MTFIADPQCTKFPLEPTIIDADDNCAAVIINGRFLKRVVTDQLETVTYRNSLGEEKPLLSAIFTTYHPVPEPFFTLAEIIEEIDVDDDGNYMLGFVSATDRRLCLKRTSYRDIIQMNSLMIVINRLHTIADNVTLDEESYRCGQRTLLEDLRYYSEDLIDIRDLPETNGDWYRFGLITVGATDYVSIITFDKDDEIIEAWIYHPKGITSIHVEPSGYLDTSGHMLPMVSIAREKNFATMLKIFGVLIGRA